jgi:DNA-binding NtrC family response regulator
VPIKTHRISRARVADNREVPSPGETTGGLPTGTEFLLLVDDDATVRGPVARFLRRLGYRVEEAESGGGALRIMARSLEEVDLLITDVQMPGMSGEELATAFTESRPGARVLYVSGDQAASRLGGSSDGRLRFLSKPLLPTELARCVREMLDAE